MSKFNESGGCGGMVLVDYYISRVPLCFNSFVP